VKRYYFLAGLAALAILYMAGPKPQAPLNNPAPSLPLSLPELEVMLQKREETAGLKPGNQARIVWADSSSKTKTAVSVVYIHGFSASFGEGDPFHRQLAGSLGANLFVARLAGHGLQDKDALKTITADDFIASAAEAIAIGRLLGDRVVIAATSMGGALALNEIARDDTQIAAVMLYSPLIDFFDPTSVLLDKPWAAQLSALVAGGDYFTGNPSPADGEKLYWYPVYHVNGLLAVKQIQLIAANPDLWKKVSVPVFTGYYYKDEAHQDHTVSAAAILTMTKGLGTPADLLTVENFPEAGAHVITSEHTTAVWPEVLEKSLAFLRTKAGL
jgi:pimeloyl-ACP methyl ester carboxylesterase